MPSCYSVHCRDSGKSINDILEAMLTSKEISEFLEFPDDIEKYEADLASREAKLLTEDLLGSYHFATIAGSQNFPAVASFANSATGCENVDTDAAEKRKRKRERNTLSQRNRRKRIKEEERDLRLAVENLVPPGMRLL